LSEPRENITIKSLAEEDRPREKLMLKGRSALSDAELIAILIGSGNTKETAVQLSQRILASAHHNLNELGKLTINDLTKFNGIGEAKAISIIAILSSIEAPLTDKFKVFFFNSFSPNCIIRDDPTTKTCGLLFS
jgi:DNA repair protein RadC